MRMIVTAVFGTALVCGLVYQFRGSPAIGRFFLAEAAEEPLPFAWPPVLNAEYPDLQLVDQTGQATRLSDYRGKVILVELVGTPCGACQAYSGGHERGTYRGGKCQANLESIEIYAKRYGGFDLKNKNVVLVQVLLFNESMQAPTVEDAAAWAKHFGMDRAKNQIVLVGLPAMATRQSFDMIPGFHLVNREFKLDRESNGLSPRHNLYTELLPRMGRLAKRGL
jgi:thiol-disulfide isomerase/thioredoxin